jgi:uncharacterized protein
VAKIHSAARAGDLAEIKKQLEAGEDVDSRDQYGHSPLNLAAGGGHTSSVKLLLSWGADVNAKGGYPNHTSLHDAALYTAKNASRVGSSEVVKVLLEAGADVNARNDYGQTPLHSAAFIVCLYPGSGSSDPLKLLLASGADVNARDNEGRTPLLFASIHAWDNVAYKEKFMILLNGGADVNVTDSFYCSSLHYSVTRNNYSIIKLLLTSGADVNARNRDGRTPLKIALDHLQSHKNYHGNGGSDTLKKLHLIIELLRRHGGIV